MRSRLRSPRLALATVTSASDATIASTPMASTKNFLDTEPPGFVCRSMLMRRCDSPWGNARSIGFVAAVIGGLRERRHGRRRHGGWGIVLVVGLFPGRSPAVATVRAVGLG